MAGPMVSGWPFSDKWQWKAQPSVLYWGIPRNWPFVIQCNKRQFTIQRSKTHSRKKAGNGKCNSGIVWSLTSAGIQQWKTNNAGFQKCNQMMETNNGKHRPSMTNWRWQKTICKLHFLLFPHYSLLSTKCTSHWPRTLTSAQSEEGNTLPGHLPIPHPPPGVTNKAIEMSERESSRTNKAESKEKEQQRGRSQNNGSHISTQNMVEHKCASRVFRKRTRCRCCSFWWISNNKELILVMAVCLLISVLTTAPLWLPKLRKLIPRNWVLGSCNAILTKC